MVIIIDRKKETAMGTTFAPVYIVIGYFDEKLYSKIKENFGEDFQRYFIKKNIMIIDYS